MNIFVTSECPVECAKFLDDRRCIKMVLETAQLLCTAINMRGLTSAPYKSTHINHPCSVWARESVGNYHWLVEHFEALCAEYTERYGKVHKCAQYKSLFRSAKFPLTMKQERTKFANCSANKALGVSFKHVKDVTSAYQQYLNVRWDNDKLCPTWRGRKL